MKKAMLIFISLILVTFISACDGNMGKNYAPVNTQNGMGIISIIKTIVAVPT